MKPFAAKMYFLNPSRKSPDFRDARSDKYTANDVATRIIHYIRDTHRDKITVGDELVCNVNKANSTISVYINQVLVLFKLTR